MIQQESHKGRLIETSGKIPTSTHNPTDKVHYIVRFRDWRLTHSVTLALDVPKMGTIGSGELENRQTSVGIPAFLLLSGPIRKRIQYLLVLNRTNRPPWISLLRNKTIRIRLGQLECVLSIWEIFQLRRSIDPRRRERELFDVVSTLVVRRSRILV